MNRDGPQRAARKWISRPPAAGVALTSHVKLSTNATKLRIQAQASGGPSAFTFRSSVRSPRSDPGRQARSADRSEIKTEVPEQGLTSFFKQVFNGFEEKL